MPLVSRLRMPGFFLGGLNMPMSRAQKVERVAAIRDQISAVEAIYLTEFRGLTVQEMQEVRRSLGESDARMRVVKMSLTRLAAADLGYDDPAEKLSGPTALVFAEGDPLVAARAVREQSREHRRLVLKGGMTDGRFLSVDQVAEFALLGSRPQLMGKVAGGLSGPINKAAGLFASFTRSAVGRLHPASGAQAGRRIERIELSFRNRERNRKWPR